MMTDIYKLTNNFYHFYQALSDEGASNTENILQEI